MGRSTFEESKGTFIVSKEKDLENTLITGLAHSLDEAKITITSIPNIIGVNTNLLDILSRNSIKVDMFFQNLSIDKKSVDISFTVSKSDLNQTLKTIENNRSDILYKDIISSSSFSKI